LGKFGLVELYYWPRAKQVEPVSNLRDAELFAEVEWILRGFPKDSWVLGNVVRMEVMNGQGDSFDGYLCEVVWTEQPDTLFAVHFDPRVREPRVIFRNSLGDSELGSLKKNYKRWPQKPPAELVRMIEAAPPLPPRPKGKLR
jgi:hypothetical protein